MDSDDIYHPSAQNDDDKVHRKAVQELKESDSGYNQVYINVVDDKERIKRKRIDVYNSGDIGCLIRDAETGKYTNARVGSLDEDNYFKVGIASGNIKKSSVSFFYLTPEHYERHQNTLLPPHVKQNWERKRLSYASKH